ncbi:MAG: glycosyltransferase family 87 protein [Pyrinomonadaceae bacterium]
MSALNEKENTNIPDRIVGWVRSTVERRLNRPYIQFICFLVLTVYAIVLTVSFATSVRGRTIFGPSLGADFGAFYIAGEIFNTNTPDRIYDTGLHHQLYQELFPDAPPDAQLPYVNAPFFILPFTILARLPYPLAYLFWVALSLALYVAGFSLIWRTLKGIPADAWFTALLLALSFMPFLVECLAGGQTSAVGFFCLALALNQERARHYILSGLALSLCAYKPTLLLLIVPMLLITRRYSTLLGFVAGGGLLTLVSLLLVGKQGCLGYINTLLYFTNASTSGASGLQSWKYVDINSFFRLLLAHSPYLRWGMTAAAFLFALPFLVRLWWKSDYKRQNEERLDWALTITWTLVLNLYVGIYDSTLVVLSLLLTTEVLYRRKDKDRPWLPTLYKLILLLVYIVPWVTQPIARLTSVQIYTVVLALLGSWQLVEFGATGRKRAAIDV